MQKVWLWLLRYCYRRIKRDGRIPTGIPGHRDPASRCDYYSPRPNLGNDPGACEGDGHYLCQECVYHSEPGGGRGEV
jgi:hypothetical protein